MTAFELLREIEARGIRVLVRGDRISLRGPESLLTQELTERLRQNKPAILEASRRCPTCAECGAAIFEPTAWWGGDPVHLDCGRRAWEREWKGEALPANTRCAMVHRRARARRNQQQVASNSEAQPLGETLWN